MQAEKQQAWRLCVDAKAKNFVFKLNATIPFSPNFKIFPFSILLKLSPSDLIKVKSQPHVYFPRKQTSFKSKFLRVLDKLRIRSSKNKAIAAKNSSNLERAKRWFLCEGQICVSSMVFGSLALLYQERDQKGIIMMYSWVLLLYLLASPLKKLIVRKTCNSKVLVIINVTMAGCSIVKNYLSFHKGGGYASRYIWKACSYFTSSGCLYALSQVIYSVLSKYIGGGGGGHISST